MPLKRTWERNKNGETAPPQQQYLRGWEHMLATRGKRFTLWDPSTDWQENYPQTKHWKIVNKYCCLQLFTCYIKDYKIHVLTIFQFFVWGYFHLYLFSSQSVEGGQVSERTFSHGLPTYVWDKCKWHWRREIWRSSRPCPTLPYRVSQQIPSSEPKSQIKWISFHIFPHAHPCNNSQTMR